MNKSMLSLTFVLTSVITVSMFSASAIAEIQSDEIIPIGTNIGIEKSVVEFHIPENNSLPWGFVEGVINNAVPDYPVIIQIYDNDDNVVGNPVGGVHFAQTDVNEDGTFEYKFRVLDVKDNSKIHVFEGDYTVKIFKVVYLTDSLNTI